MMTLKQSAKHEVCNFLIIQARNCIQVIPNKDHKRDKNFCKYLFKAKDCRGKTS